MDLLIGIGMLVFFGYTVATFFLSKDLEPDPKFYAQMLISGAGSFYLLVVQNLDKVKELLSKLRKKTVDNKDKKEEETLPLTTDKEYMDYQCLVYLKKRADELKSKEALDLVIKLNTLLFSSGKQIQ